MTFILLTKLLQYLSHLVDQEQEQMINVEEALDIITQGNIIDWLSDNYKNLDLSLHKNQKDEINDLIKDEYQGSSSSLHAKGIDNNGLCCFITLIADAMHRKYQENTNE